ncbi:F-box only protein 16 [Etheostoma cragini]|uniref:F-box only protein 16 n=1 Tax=Etheostoma cragini TaxID=417921 RepID=UPI00155EEF9A|nr:F-box only protein 16 [Etheostoma cragini]
MPVAPRSSAKMQTKLSAWTPLNHPESNSKVFEERRNLLAKWFARWSDSQRKALLQDLVLSCSVDQLLFLKLSVGRRLPLQAADFTCLLPRALCLYLFSFLDPRSLCRCAQVSWLWRSIVELDQLWMPKCVRLGWCINFSPTPLEQAVWKRLYVHTVQELRVTALQVRRPDPQSAHQQQPKVPHVSAISSRHGALSEPAVISDEHATPPTQVRGGTSRTGFRKEKQTTTPPPWKDSDRRPTDTLRFNYLDNLEPSDAAYAQLSLQPTSYTIGSTGRRGNTSQPDDRSQKTVSAAHYKLRKAKSLMFLSSNCRPQHPPPPHETQSRPSWAARSPEPPVTKETAKSVLRLAQWNAGIRPGPARPAVPRLSVEALRAAQRTHRSAPSTQLFQAQPWTVPASHTQDMK